MKKRSIDVLDEEFYLRITKILLRFGWLSLYWVLTDIYCFVSVVLSYGEEGKFNNAVDELENNSKFAESVKTSETVIDSRVKKNWRRDYLKGQSFRNRDYQLLKKHKVQWFTKRDDRS